MKYLGNNQNLKNKKSKETQNYIEKEKMQRELLEREKLERNRIEKETAQRKAMEIKILEKKQKLNIKKMNKNDQINKLRKYIENGTITNQNKIIYITMIKKIILEQFKNLHSPVYLKYNNNILYLSEKKITNFFNNVDELNKLNNNASTHSGDINIKRTKKVEKNRVRLIKHFFRESINDDSVCSSDMGSSSGSDSQLGGGAHDNEIGKKKKINELLDEEDEEEEKKQLEIIREMQAKNNNIEDNENNYKLIHCLKWTRIYIKKHDNTTSIYEFTEPGENYGNVDANSRIDNYENNYKEGEMNEISPNKSYKYEIMKRRKEILLKNSFKDVEKCLSSENNYIENVQTLYIYGKKNIETFLKWKHFRSLIKKYFILMQNKESEQKNLDAGEINQLNPKQAGDDSYAYNDQGTINDNILFNNGIVKKRKYKKHKKKLLETPESFKTIINIFPTVGDDIKHWNTDKKYSEQNNLKTEKKKLKDKYGDGNEYGKNKDAKKKHLYDLSGDNSGKIINKKFMNTNYSINIKKNNKRYRQNTALKRKDKNVYNTAKSNLSISKKRKGGKLQANQKSYNNDPNNGEQNDEQIESDEYNMIESGKRRGYEDENERKKKKRKKDKLINNTDEHMNKTSSTTEKYVRGSSMVSESSANLNAHNDKNVDESSRKKSKKGNTYNNIKEIIENFNEKLLTIMKDISQVLNYKAFLNQVNETYAPMYYSVIKKPMYINKIIFRCKKRKYNNLSLFIDDVYLIVTNCKLYNTPTSVSAYLRDIVDNMFLDIVNKIKGDDNLQNYNSILIEHFYKNKHFNNTWESINIEQSDLLNNSELSMNKTSDLTINNMQQENLSSNFMASIDQSRNYNNTMDTDFNLNTMSANFNKFKKKHIDDTLDGKREINYSFAIYDLNNKSKYILDDVEKESNDILIDFCYVEKKNNELLDLEKKIKNLKNQMELEMKNKESIYKNMIKKLKKEKDLELKNLMKINKNIIKEKKKMENKCKESLFELEEKHIYFVNQLNSQFYLTNKICEEKFLKIEEEFDLYKKNTTLEFLELKKEHEIKMNLLMQEKNEEIQKKDECLQKSEEKYEQMKKEKDQYIKEIEDDVDEEILLLTKKYEEEIDNLKKDKFDLLGKFKLHEYIEGELNEGINLEKDNFLKKCIMIKRMEE
ncbi:bromodomain protein, putative, partial [Plasmodium ovale curtisi]